MLNCERRASQILGSLRSIPSITLSGKLTRLSGMVMEATGPMLPVGAACEVQAMDGSAVDAEVVGFDGSIVRLMPLGQTSGITAGARVTASINSNFDVTQRLMPAGFGMLGRIVDSIGRPLDGKGPVDAAAAVPFYREAFNPMLRAPIDRPMDVGVRALNSLLTVGRGQRIGLFAGSGVGKSVLLGMMVRYAKADVVVVGLIGERGREVREFIEDSLGPEGLARSVVVAAAADTSPLMRLHGAASATALAEYFRDQGKHVLLIMDSLTRYAMAQREIALASGEPPATKGYPPSVFGKLPALVERAGNGLVGGGSITAFYTVLSEGDDQQDPVADAARAVLDGHVVLSRRLAEVGHYPAIDVGASASRVMPFVVTPRHMELARKLRGWSSRYEESKDLINVGAYQRGADPELDMAIEKIGSIRQFLQQGMHERAGFDESLAGLSIVTGMSGG
jgi:flagellum-specific ATP synthase